MEEEEGEEGGIAVVGTITNDLTNITTDMILVLSRYGYNSLYFL